MPATPMSCPHCAVPLVMSERQGIEIDYCPTCRGVWLDRGELDKIIERSARDLAAEAPSAPQAPQAPQPGYAPQAPQPGYPPQQPFGYGDRGQHGHYKHKRRKSFLEELFD